MIHNTLVYIWRHGLLPIWGFIVTWLITAVLACMLLFKYPQIPSIAFYPLQAIILLCNATGWLIYSVKDYYAWIYELEHAEETVHNSSKRPRKIPAKVLLVLFCALLVALSLPPQVAGITWHQLNYTVPVTSQAQLGQSTIFTRNVNLTFNSGNATNVTVGLHCSPWLHSCISPLLVQGEIMTSIVLVVPNTSVAGLNWQNLTLLNNTNEMVQPDGYKFRINVSHHFTTTSSTTTTITANATAEAKKVAKVIDESKSSKHGPYKANQANLPYKFKISDIKLAGYAGEIVNVTYEGWLSGPKKLTFISDRLTTYINVTVPKYTAVDDYGFVASYTDTRSKKTMYFAVDVDVEEPDWSVSGLTDAATWDALSEPEKNKLILEYFKSRLDKFIELQNNLTQSGKITVVDKYRVVPMNYSYMANLVANCDPGLLQNMKDIENLYNTFNSTSMGEWSRCEGELVNANNQMKNIEAQLLRMQGTNVNNTILIEHLNKDLATYDKRNVRNSTFLWVLFPAIIAIGAWVVVFIKNELEDMEGAD